jgi:hypothetical protein
MDLTRRLLVASALTSLFIVGTAAQWQAPRWRAAAADPPPAADEGRVPYNGRFVFVRLRYRWGFEGGLGRRGWMAPWAHDYPRAEKNLAKILEHLTYIRPYLDGSNVLALDDAALGEFPFAYMSEPGGWSVTEEEAAGLRRYLSKGGFLIFDDFRGWDWQNLEAQMRRVLPEGRFIELAPTHPIFHCFFEIDPREFVPMYDEGRPVFYGLFEDNDPTKRLMAVANYNNDIGEYWEFSDTGWVPIDLSNEAYKFGVNYIIYAMTH